MIATGVPARSRAGLTALLCVCAAGASAVGVDAQTAAPGAIDSAAVRVVWATVDTAWNTRDAGRFADLFAEYGNFIVVDRFQSLEGREAILRSFAERFPRFAPELRHRTTVREVRAIVPDVVTIDGTVEILRLGSEVAEKPSILRTFAIFAVMLQGADGWKIRELRVYELADAAESG